jgi:thiaminase
MTKGSLLNSQKGQEIFLFSTASRMAMGSGMFPHGENCQDMKLTTHLHLVSKLRMDEAYLHYTRYLHGMVHKDNFTFFLYMISSNRTTLYQDFILEIY